jgi:hypothetical protein
MVTSLSKRAASSGEKIVLASSLTLHHLPRQPFGGKVHLFGDAIQFNRSIFFHVEGRTGSITQFKRFVGKAKPAARNSKRNLLCTDFYHCVIPAIQSVGRGVRAKQRSPRGPKFSSEACIEHQRLAVDLAEHNIDRSDDGYDIGEKTSLAHSFQRLQCCESRISHVDAVRLGGTV